MRLNRVITVTFFLLILFNKFGAHGGIRTPAIAVLQTAVLPLHHMGNLALQITLITRIRGPAP